MRCETEVGRQPGEGVKKGAAEHPEELTDRCCLSALAGLSKYLPFFGTAGYYTKFGTYVNFPIRAIQGFFPVGGKFLHVYYLNKNSVVLVGHVDSWKTVFHGI